MKLTIQDMTRCALFVVLIAIGAFIKIPISLVPITLQTLFVLLASLLLGRKLASLSMMVYLFLGLIGLPVFANGGGIAYIFQPSFGYLLGFLAATFVVGTLKEKTTSSVFVFCICLLGVVVIYSFGIVYFAWLQNIYFQKNISFAWMFYTLFLAYLPGDILSCLLATWLWKRLTGKILD